MRFCPNIKFKFGAKIFAKIVAAAKPDEDLGEEAVNVFDPSEGADFLLRQTVVAGFPNYDGSKFGPKKAIPGGQKKIDELLAKCFVLENEITPDKFKSEEDLKKKFLWVTGGEDKKGPSSYDKELDELTKIAAEPAAPTPKKASPPMPKATDADDEDDSAFFASLVD